MDAFARAIMEYRNTPNYDTGCSPAQVVFVWPLQDFIPMVRGDYAVQP